MINTNHTRLVALEDVVSQRVTAMIRELLQLPATSNTSTTLPTLSDLSVFRPSTVDTLV